MKQLLLIVLIVLMNSTVIAQQIDRFPIYPGCERYMKDNQKLNGCFQERLMKDLDLYFKSERPKNDTIKPELVKIAMIVDEKGKLKDFEITEDSDAKAANKLMKRLTGLQKQFEKSNKKIIPASYRKRNVNFKVVFVGTQFV